jgi:hypothetical protein
MMPMASVSSATPAAVATPAASNPVAFGDVSMGMPTSSFGAQGPSGVGPAGQGQLPLSEMPLQNAAQPANMMDNLKAKLGELGYDDYMDMAQQAMEGMGGGGEEQQGGGMGIPAMQPGMPLGSVHQMQNHLAPLMGGGGGGGGGRGGLFG